MTCRRGPGWCGHHKNSRYAFHLCFSDIFLIRLFGRYRLTTLISPKISRVNNTQIRYSQWIFLLHAESDLTFHSLHSQTLAFFYFSGAAEPSIKVTRHCGPFKLKWPFTFFPLNTCRKTVCLRTPLNNRRAAAGQRCGWLLSNYIEKEWWGDRGAFCISKVLFLEPLKMKHQTGYLGEPGNKVQGEVRWLSTFFSLVLKV